jgi:hypothetical protein
VTAWELENRVDERLEWVGSCQPTRRTGRLEPDIQIDDAGELTLPAVVPGQNPTFAHGGNSMVLAQCHLALYYAEIAQYFDGLPQLRLRGGCRVLRMFYLDDSWQQTPQS